LLYEHISEEIEAVALYVCSIILLVVCH